MVKPDESSASMFSSEDEEVKQSDTIQSYKDELSLISCEEDAEHMVRNM